MKSTKSADSALTDLHDYFKDFLSRQRMTSAKALVIEPNDRLHARRLFAVIVQALVRRSFYPDGIFILHTAQYLLCESTLDVSIFLPFA